MVVNPVSVRLLSSACCTFGKVPQLAAACCSHLPTTVSCLSVAFMVKRASRSARGPTDDPCSGWKRRVLLFVPCSGVSVPPGYKHCNGAVAGFSTSRKSWLANYFAQFYGVAPRPFRHHWCQLILSLSLYQ